MTAVWYLTHDGLTEGCLIIMENRDEADRLAQCLRDEGLVAKAWIED